MSFNLPNIYLFLGVRFDSDRRSLGLLFLLQPTGKDSGLPPPASQNPIGTRLHQKFDLISHFWRITHQIQGHKMTARKDFIEYGPVLTYCCNKTMGGYYQAIHCGRLSGFFTTDDKLYPTWRDHCTIGRRRFSSITQLFLQCVTWFVTFNKCKQCLKVLLLLHQARWG